MLNSLQLGELLERERGGSDTHTRLRERAFPPFSPEAFEVAAFSFGSEEAIELASRRLKVHDTMANNAEGRTAYELLKEHGALREVAFGGIDSMRLWHYSDRLVDLYYALVRPKRR